jgi:hypothetical protein
MMQSGEQTKMLGCGTRLSRSRTNTRKLPVRFRVNRNNISRNTAKWSGIRDSLHIVTFVGFLDTL